MARHPEASLGEKLLPCLGPEHPEMRGIPQGLCFKESWEIKTQPRQPSCFLLGYSLAKPKPRSEDTGACDKLSVFWKEREEKEQVENIQCSCLWLESKDKDLHQGPDHSSSEPQPPQTSLPSSTPVEQPAFPTSRTQAPGSCLLLILAGFVILNYCLFCFIFQILGHLG